MLDESGVEGCRFSVFDALAPTLTHAERQKPLGETHFFEVWKTRMDHVKVFGSLKQLIRSPNTCSLLITVFYLLALCHNC